MLGYTKLILSLAAASAVFNEAAASRSAEPEAFRTQKNVSGAEPKDIFRNPANFSRANRDEDLFRDIAPGAINSLLKSHDAGAIAAHITSTDMANICDDSLHIKKGKAEIFVSGLKPEACTGIHSFECYEKLRPTASACVKKVPMTEWDMDTVDLSNWMAPQWQLIDTTQALHLLQVPVCKTIDFHRFIAAPKLLKFMTSACFAKVQHVKSDNRGSIAITGPNMRAFPVDMFAKTNKELDSTFFEQIDENHLRNFGTARKDQNQCDNVRMTNLNGKAVKGLTAKCYAGALRGNFPGPIGKDTKYLPTDVLTLIGEEEAMHINRDDWQYFTAEHWAGLPDLACLGVSSDARLGVGTKPSAACFGMLKPAVQKQYFDLVGAKKVTPHPDFLANVTSEQLSALGGARFFERTKLSGEVLKHLSEKVDPREHACHVFDRVSQLMHASMSAFRQNMGHTCLTAIPILADLTTTQLKQFSHAAQSGMTVEQLRNVYGANFLVEADDAFLAALFSRAHICGDLGYDEFLSNASRIAPHVSVECAKAFAFKGRLTKSDVSSMPAMAFAKYDVVAAGELSSVAILSKAQIASLGSEVAEEVNPATAFNAALIKTFTLEQANGLNKVQLRLMPTEAYGGFSKEQIGALDPASLTNLTKEQVAAISDEAFGGFQVSHFESMGSAIEKTSASHPRHAITKAKLEQLSSKARDACSKHVGENAAIGQAVAQLTMSIAVVATMILF